MVDAVPCTGIAAQWCPRCGDCSCPRDEEGWLVGSMDHPGCPLHALSSDHALRLVGAEADAQAILDGLARATDEQLLAEVARRGLTITGGES